MILLFHLHVGNCLGEFWAFGQNLPKLLESFLVLFSLTSFNRTRFQIVANFCLKTNSFCLLPCLCYKCDRKQTHLVTSKKNKR